MKRALDCLCKYIIYWLNEIVAKAEQTTDTEYKKQVKAKKEKIREIYRRQDPRGTVMVALFGKELVWEGLQLTFRQLSSFAAYCLQISRPLLTKKIHLLFLLFFMGIGFADAESF